VSKHSPRPKGIDDAIAKGIAGEGVPTMGGKVLCPYSWNSAWYWAWTGAYEATHGDKT
jgi:hypothetical protein